MINNKSLYHFFSDCFCSCFLNAFVFDCFDFSLYWLTMSFACEKLLTLIWSFTKFSNANLLHSLETPKSKPKMMFSHKLSTTGCISGFHPLSFQQVLKWSKLYYLI